MDIKNRLFFVLTVGLTLIVTSIQGQNSIAEAVDQLLVDEFNEMMKVEPAVRYNVHAPKFRENLENVLSLEESFDYPFTQLSKLIKIVRSEDGKFRTFSWDEKTGGSWYDMTAFAQYLNEKGKVVFSRLDTGSEGSDGSYTDVIIYEIHQFSIDDTINYLTIGGGTHGSGHHFKSARLFKPLENKLQGCNNCFQGDSILHVEAPRSVEILMKYDPEKKELAYSEFIFDEEKGYYKSSGKIVVLTLVEGKFVRVEG